MASAGGSSKDQISLFLTPMLDIFSILITFLLMSFSSDPVSHDVDPALELPESRTIIALDEIPAITVTKNDIQVNDKKIVTLVGGKLKPEDEQQDRIPALHQELKLLAEANSAIKKRKRQTEAGTPFQPDALTMEMDKGHRFELMRQIMGTATQSEFITFKLMVSKELN